jgi:hypothetical protein
MYIVMDFYVFRCIEMDADSALVDVRVRALMNLRRLDSG